MITITIITFILALGLGSTQISSIQYSRLAAISFLLSAFLSFNVLYIESLGNGLGIFSGLYQVSSVSQSIETFIYVMASLILIPWFISTASPRLTGPVLSEYSLILLFSVLGATLLVSSTDLISMYLSIELQSFAVYILASIHRDSESATAAGLKYFLLGGLSSCFILLGAGLIYSYTGLTHLESIFNLLLTVASTSYSVMPIVGLLFIITGFLFKIAAAPLHNWAPDVYDEVPTMVTTWLTIMPKISIVIFLLEIISSTVLGFNGSDGTWSLPITSLLLFSSLLSLIIGSVVGLAQYKLKRLMAYSTISHVGFLLLALAINTEQSTESLIFYLLQYSVTTLNTFLIILALGYTGRRLQNNHGTDISFISELRAQFSSNPVLSLSLTLCLFSMAGIPPLVGFFAKLQVLSSASYSGYYFMTVIAILVSVISASYYLQIIKVMHFSSVEVKEAATANTLISNSHSMLISVLTLSIVLFILNPNIILNSSHLLALTIFQT